MFSKYVCFFYIYFDIRWNDGYLKSIELISVLLRTIGKLK